MSDEGGTHLNFLGGGGRRGSNEELLGPVPPTVPRVSTHPWTLDRLPRAPKTGLYPVLLSESLLSFPVLSFSFSPPSPRGSRVGWVRRTEGPKHAWVRPSVGVEAPHTRSTTSPVFEKGRLGSDTRSKGHLRVTSPELGHPG